MRAGCDTMRALVMITSITVQTMGLVGTRTHAQVERIVNVAAKPDVGQNHGSFMYRRNRNRMWSLCNS